MSEQNASEDAKNVLAEMLRQLDIPSTVDVIEADDSFKLSIQSEEAGRLIGKKGQTLESLELILNRILKKHEDGNEHSAWVSIDVDGYCVETPHRENERFGKLPRTEIDRLEALARDIAKEVRKLGTPRVIGPYSPSERRIIHLTLENDPDIETVSDPEADKDRGKKITVKLRDN